MCFGPGGATVSQTDSPRLPGRVRSCRRTRYVFDVLVHRGCDVIRLPLESRRELLTDAIRKVGYPVIQSIAFDVKPGDLVKAAKALELEGVIAKRKGSLYESGRRSGAWVKYKINRSQEFVIGGYTVGNPFDALIVGCYEDRIYATFPGSRQDSILRYDANSILFYRLWKSAGVRSQTCRNPAVIAGMWG